MATGDNPFTSISVAQECGLVECNKDIFFCNLEKDKINHEEKLKWYNVNIRKETLIRKAQTKIIMKKNSYVIKGKFILKLR